MILTLSQDLGYKEDQAEETPRASLRCDTPDSCKGIEDKVSNKKLFSL